MKISGFWKGVGAVLVILVIAIALGYVANPLKGKTLDVGGNSNDDDTPMSFIQTSVTPSAVDAYTATAVTGTATTYTGGVKGSVSLGSAFNVPAGEEYEVIFDDGSHYYAKITGTGPKNGNVPAQIDMMPNGTLTGTFINAVGTASTAQTLSAGDEKYVKVLLAAQNDKVFSNPQSTSKPVICFNYNTTAIDKIEVDGGSKTGIPQQAVGTYEECYDAPFTSLADGGEHTVRILVDADDTNAPAHDATMIVYDADMYVVSSGLKVGQRLYGVENNAGTDIGGVNPTVTLDFTS